MPQELDDITVINRALALLRSPPLAALDEESSKARQVSLIWDDLVEGLLGGYSWSFARKTYALDLLAETPVNGFKHAFGLPGTRLGNPLKVLDNPADPDRPLRHWLLEDGRLFADTTPLWASFRVRAAPSEWSPAFRMLVTTAAAARLAMPITSNEGLGDYYQRQAFGGPMEAMQGGLFGRAVIADAAAAAVAPHLASDPLTAAHRS